MAKTVKINIAHFTDPVVKIYTDTLPAVQVGTVGGYTCVADPTGSARRSFDGSDIPSGVYVVIGTFPLYVGYLIMGSSAGVYNVTDTLSAASGTGARTVTVTVNDGTNPVESATVRLTKGAESFIASTNASGVATFNVDDGTWTVAITASGYSFAGATLVVDGAETPTYSLTQLSFSASPPDQITGYWVVLDETGAVEPDVVINMRFKCFKDGNEGVAYDSKTRTATSNVSGIAEFPGLHPESEYEAWRTNTTRKFIITTPALTPSAVPLGSIIGADE